MVPFASEDLDIVTVASLEYTAGVTAHAADHATAPTWVISRLSVTGPWECGVEVAIDADLARMLTSLMWEQEAVLDDDVCDAVGEIANVIAGGIKGMTPVPGCGLTLPVTTFANLAPAPAAPTQLRRHFLVMSKAVVVTTTC